MTKRDFIFTELSNGKTLLDFPKIARSDEKLAEKVLMNPDLRSNFKYFTADLQEKFIEKSFLNYEYASSEVKNIPRVALKAVSQNGYPLKFATKFKDDEVIVTTAIKSGGFALQYAGDKFKDDPQIVKLAISNYPEALEYASPRLKNDKEIVLTAVSRNGEAYQFIGQNLKDDIEIAQTAIDNTYLAMQYMSEDILSERSISLSIVNQDGLALIMLPEQMQYDPEIITAAVRQNYDLYDKLDRDQKEKIDDIEKIIFLDDISSSYLDSFMSEEDYKAELNYLGHEELLDDYDIIEAILKKGGYLIQYMPDEIKNDKSLVERAYCYSNEGIFNILGDKFKNEILATENKLKEFIHKSNIAYTMISDHFQANENIAKEFLKLYPHKLKQLPEKFQTDINFLSNVAAKNPELVNYVDNKLRNDYDFMKEIIRVAPHKIELLGNDLKFNNELNLYAVSKNGMLLQSLPPELKDREEIVTRAIENDINAVQFASPRLQEKFSNLVEFHDVSNFLIDSIEKKFGTLDLEFKTDFLSSIQEMELKYNDFNYSQLKEDFLIAIENADKFNDLHFSYEEQTYKLDYLNDKIKNGLYKENFQTQKKEESIMLKKGSIIETPLSKNTTVLEVFNGGKDAVLFTGSQYVYANGILKRDDNKTIDWKYGDYSFDLQGIVNIMQGKDITDTQNPWDQKLTNEKKGLARD